MQFHKIEWISNYTLKNDELINFLYDPNQYTVKTMWMLLTFWKDYGDNYMLASSWHEDVLYSY